MDQLWAFRARIDPAPATSTGTLKAANSHTLFKLLRLWGLFLEKTPLDGSHPSRHSRRDLFGGPAQVARSIRCAPGGAA
jgi:hypothetical protein